MSSLADRRDYRVADLSLALLHKLGVELWHVEARRYVGHDLGKGSTAKVVRRVAGTKAASP